MDPVDTTDLEWVTVESSNLEMVAWQDYILYVGFVSGSIYFYTGVPEEVYHALLDAESHGEYLNEKIKPIYPYMKIEAVEDFGL